MSEENIYNECKFFGHERPLGLEWPKNLHEWWVFPTNFQKLQGREWYLFHNDVFPNFCEDNEWGKQSLEWGKYCQNDTMILISISTLMAQKIMYWFRTPTNEFRLFLAGGIHKWSLGSRTGSQKGGKKQFEGGMPICELLGFVSVLINQNAFPPLTK